MINKIFNEDCLIGMQRIPDKSIDCIICDLPYGQTWAKWDTIIPSDKLWEQYNRIIKENGAVVLFSCQPFTTLLVNSNIKKYKYSWYWVKDNKGNFLNAKYQPLRQLEEINVFNKHNYYPQGVIEGDKKVRKGGRPKITLLNYKSEYVQHFTGYPSNVLNFGLDRDNIHPTQKPLKLIEYLIKTYSNENEVILDNCMGSGTTAIAAINTNRKYIGFEMDKTYFDIAQKRIQNAQTLFS